MLQLDKKKRTNSGSRSKSRKYRGYQYSVDVRNKYSQGDHGKVKTENSASLNRSRPSRKNSTKQKKHTKSNNRDSKDPNSHSVSADRRHSVMKANRTQANFDQDFDLAIDQLILQLKSIPQPPCLNARLMGKYFSDMRRYFSSLEGPFHRLCLELHSFYVHPMQKFLQLVAPMEDAIKRKQEVTRQIDRQIMQNQQLYSKLDPIDIEIFKLKQKIEENRVIIEHKREQKQHRSRDFHNNSQHSLNGIDHNQTEEISPRQIEPEQQAKAEPVGKGFRLDLGNIGKLNHMSYQEEFELMIPEFSQSWRDQALRQKRF